MAIIGFTGTPGSGKSYDAVVKIIDNLKMARTVYTNIEGMNNLGCRQMIMMLTGLTDYGLACKLNTLSNDQTFEFWEHVQPGSLIVIDEVQNYFGSREWQTEKNKSFGRWASTHRHHGYEVLLITQDVERIDTLVRSLLEWTYVYRKINFFGSLIQKQYLCYSYAGNETSKKALATKKKTYDPQIFACYKSYVASDIKEQGLMQHVNVLKHPVFYILPILICITVYMVFFKSSIGTGDPFGSKKMLAQASAKTKRITSNHVEKRPPTTLPGQLSNQIHRRVKDDVVLYTNRM